MPRQPEELLHSNAVEWIHETLKQDQRISEEIEQDFLRFNTFFDGLGDELLLEIGSHLQNESDISNLVSTSKRMYSLFQPRRLSDKFLQRVAYGEQEQAERLFTDVYQGNVEKIQTALCCQRRFTDYSGRTFHCSAYEYAYWAKDAHMCRMLERHMDDATKAQMLARIKEIERIDKATGKPKGLKYQQHGAEHRSAHFDLTPLITALQEYVNGFDAWRAAKNWAAMRAAWMKVGIAQRDVPAHVAQEYCRPDRSVVPLPFFNVDREGVRRETLPRVFAFYNWNNHRDELWFPLGQVGSGLGFDFALVRLPAGVDGRWVVGLAGLLERPDDDLAAVSHLDKVRTVELAQSREHLKPPEQLMELSM